MKFNLDDIMNKEVTVQKYIHEEGCYKAIHTRMEQDSEDPTGATVYIYFRIVGTDDIARLRTSLEPAKRKDGTYVTTKVMDENGNVTEKKLTGLELTASTVSQALGITGTSNIKEIFDKWKSTEIEAFCTSATTKDGRPCDAWTISPQEIAKLKKIYED